jgi:NitT/TauT family transport system ATP-binding protein
VTAISGLSLDVPEGEFLTLLGPSGCGKSTFLRVVADLLPPSSGLITVLGDKPSRARANGDVAFVFQDAALMPWRTVLQNIELPLEIAGKSPREHRVRTMELLDLVGLRGSENAYPNELSGGMRQRVSIARALIGNPRVLLMDEPFGALDEIVRDRLNDEIRRIWKETKLTILFVTHSIYEAAYLGERVLVLSANPGRVRDIVPVPLPYERTLEARETPEFVSLAARLRRTLETC